jgi:hypothetical protein
LTRHPTTSQASLAQHLLRTVPEHARLDEPMAGIAAWCKVHARIMRFAASLPGDRIMRVRAEDVLNDAPAQLRAIAAWLGLRTDLGAIAAMLCPQASPFARFAPAESGAIGGHDHDFLRDPTPRRVELPATVEPPPGWHGASRLWRGAAALARELGYGEACAPRARRSPADGTRNLGALRVELLRRGDIDGAARRACAGTPAELARLMEMDSENTAWLATIIDKIGWPGRSLVGEDGAHAAWLIVQHADLNRSFQQRCLKLLREAVEAGEAAPVDLAHLTDRVLLAKGRPQRYGTQTIVRDGRYQPAPIKDKKSVDARRATVGLPPLAADLPPARALHRTLSAPARTPCPACAQPMAVRRPKPGGTTRFQCPACGATGTVHAPKPAAPVRV